MTGRVLKYEVEEEMAEQYHKPFREIQNWFLIRQAIELALAKAEAETTNYFSARLFEAYCLGIQRETLKQDIKVFENWKKKILKKRLGVVKQ